MEYAPTLEDRLQFFCTCAPGGISQLAFTTVPQDRLPVQYLEGLTDEDKTVCFRASMICWAVSAGAMVPR